MIEYIEDQDGFINLDGKMIPSDPKNKDRARILREVAAGTATIVSEG